MTHGFHGPEVEKYRPFYAYLAEIDPVLTVFVVGHSQLQFESVNDRNFPERSICWRNRAGLRTHLQILLNEKTGTFRVRGCAAKDKKLKRYAKKRDFALSLKPPLDKNHLRKLLESSYQWLNQIREKDLEFSADLYSRVDPLKGPVLEEKPAEKPPVPPRIARPSAKPRPKKAAAPRRARSRKNGRR